MSYARFGWGSSDVYVYLDVDGYLCCCGCHLRDGWGKFYSTGDMIAHLRDEHIAAGDVVPDDVISDLEADREENDQWIAAKLQAALDAAEEGK